MMEDVEKQVEKLFDAAVDYGKTSLELTKLKAIDKISDIAASLISKIFSAIIVLCFLLFATLGLAFWLGDVLGKVYLGFFAVAAIYGILAILIHLVMSKWVKKLVCNFIIKNALN